MGGDTHPHSPRARAGRDALPHGARSPSGSYFGLGNTGAYWLKNNWHRNLVNNNTKIDRNDTPSLKHGYVVRCLQNIYGCTDPGAPNYDADAEVDNGSCYFNTISEILTTSMIGQEVIIAGVISDYFDIGDLIINDMIDSLKNNSQDINKVKILLANEATTMLHGVKAAKDSEITAQKTFVDKSIGKDLPIIKVKKNTIANGINIFDLVLQTKLANSKGEIRRMIKNNGLKINNEVLKDETKIINQNNFDENNNMKVSHGKKQHVIVKII